MFSSLLDQSLTIQRQTIAPDASGGSTRSFAAVATNVPCAVAPASATVTADYTRRDMIVDCHVYTAANLDTLLPGGPRLGDRFTDGTIYYLVKGVQRFTNAVIASEPVYQLDCERRV
jgi:hypothetical protein